MNLVTPLSSLREAQLEWAGIREGRTIKRVKKNYVSKYMQNLLSSVSFLRKKAAARGALNIGGHQNLFMTH